jgi:hypothetical protein
MDNVVDNVLCFSVMGERISVNSASEICLSTHHLTLIMT